MLPSAPPQLKIYHPGEGPPNRGICLYSKSGLGKTTLLGTMPRQVRGLVVEVPQIEGGGTVVLADHRDHIDVTPVHSWAELDDVHKYLESGNHPYKWVAMDTATAMQKLAKRKAIKERDLKADPHKVTQPDWGVIGELMGELFYRFLSLPIVTIWTAQERRHDREGDGSMLIGPDVSPMALASLMPSMMLMARLSVVYNLDGTSERQLRLTPHENYLVKYRAIRSVDMPDAVRNPDLSKILRYMAGNLPREELDVVEGDSNLFAFATTVDEEIPE